MCYWSTRLKAKKNSDGQCTGTVIPQRATVSNWTQPTSTNTAPRLRLRGWGSVRHPFVFRGCLLWPGCGCVWGGEGGEGVNRCHAHKKTNTKKKGRDLIMESHEASHRMRPPPHRRGLALPLPRAGIRMAVSGCKGGGGTAVCDRGRKGGGGRATHCCVAVARLVGRG